jgi:hypothetical protein
VSTLQLGEVSCQDLVPAVVSDSANNAESNRWGISGVVAALSRRRGNLRDKWQERGAPRQRQIPEPVYRSCRPPDRPESEVSWPTAVPE